MHILCFLSLIILQFVYNLLQNLGGTVALLQWVAIEKLILLFIYLFIYFKSFATFRLLQT